MKLNALKQGGASLHPRIETVNFDAPWIWMSKGWNDFRKKPLLSLGYGLVVSLGGLLLTLGLFSLNMSALVLALAAGFFLVAPLLAVGLYEISRALEAGEPVGLRRIVAATTRAPIQLSLLGVVLMGGFLIWVRIASLLFALFFGTLAWPPLSEFVNVLLFSPQGLGLLVVGTAVGGAIALAIFAVSAVSVPLLMSEDTDAVSAILASVQAVLVNPRPMLLWAWLILMMTAFGLVTGFLGLVVCFPLIGYATWHAYRALITLKEPAAGAPEAPT